MSQPVRVVAQHAPNLFAIVGLFDPDGLPSSTEFDGETYYRAESHDHWVLYKRAISGWGGLTPDPNKARPGSPTHSSDGVDPRQR